MLITGQTAGSPVDNIVASFFNIVFVAASISFNGQKVGEELMQMEKKND